MVWDTIVGAISPLANNKSKREQEIIPLAIIGDGYTAAAFVYHLMKQGIPAGEITVFGKGRLGQGRAYGAKHQDYRLNVRAELMQLDDDEPDAFPEWARTNIDDPLAQTDAGAFYRRADYARYLEAELQHCLKGQALTQIKKEITALHQTERGWQLTTDDGEMFEAGKTVIATGNPPSNPLFEIPSTLKNIINHSPWHFDGFEHLNTYQHIAIIGGGLTGLDLVTALANSGFANSGFKGHISIITPEGFLPPEQLNWSQDKAEAYRTDEWVDAKSASQFANIFLKSLNKNGLNNDEQQERFEALRLDINQHWKTLSLEDRKRLLKRFGWIWQKIRYRATPQAHRAIATLKDKNQLNIIAGRVINMIEDDSKARLILDKGEAITADYVFVATGRGVDPLIQQLMKDNIAVAPFQTDAAHQVMMPFENDRLFALGPPTMMSQGDIFGATTIAKYAKALALQFKDARQTHGR